MQPYYNQYINLVGDANLIDALSEGASNTRAFFESIPREKLVFQYAEGKWTPKQILLHLIDTERVFAYRALYFSRNPGTRIKGFDENVFADNATAADRSLESLLNEYENVRAASIHLFENLNEEELKRIGNASDSDLSVRACAFIVGGHEKHHIKVIKERYL